MLMFSIDWYLKKLKGRFGKDDFSVNFCHVLSFWIYSSQVEL